MYKITIEKITINQEDQTKYPRREEVYSQTFEQETSEGSALIIQNVIRAVNQITS